MRNSLRPTTLQFFNVVRVLGTYDWLDIDKATYCGRNVGPQLDILARKLPCGFVAEQHFVDISHILVGNCDCLSCGGGLFESC